MHITIIEDNPLFAKNAFDQLGGSTHNINFISTADEAIKYLLALKNNEFIKPDAILIDCMYPTIPDLERVNLIKNISSLPDNYAIKTRSGKDDLIEEMEQIDAQENKNYEIIKFENKINQLERDLYRESPTGYHFVTEAIFLQIPYIGMLRGSAHAAPPIGQYGQMIFYDGNPNYETDNEVHKKKNQKGKIGNSSVIWGEAGYNEHVLKDELLVSTKRWDLLLDDLIKL